MSRAAELAAFLVLLAVLGATSSPRRVGDGAEYMAVALNLAAGRGVSLSPADLAAVDPVLDACGGRDAIQSVRFPSLVGADGRQDVPHAWVYPALVAPVLSAIQRLGGRINDAFTLVNVVLLAFAWTVLRRVAGCWVAVATLVSPILWWVDKAHAEVFLFSTLVAAAALAARGRVLALPVAGAAAAQNPALIVVWPFVCLETLRHASPLSRGRTAVAGAFTLGLAGAVPLYSLRRLGTPSPLSAWTAWHVPTVREIVTPIVDLNIGLATLAPLLVFALAWLVVEGVRVPRAPVPRTALAVAAATALLVLAVAAQSTNVNHGGTAGLSRYALWLVPLCLPFACVGDRPPGRVPRMLVAASAVWCLVGFHPARPELYRYPSPVADRVWRTMPDWDNPHAEVFAERTSHREPAAVPTAVQGCAKILLFEGRWPAPCFPDGPLPPSCAARGRLCYANRVDAHYVFRLVPASWFPHELNVVGWKHDALEPVVARRLLERLDVPGLTPVRIAEPGFVVRAVEGMRWSWALQGTDQLFVYLSRPRPGASLTLRMPSRLRGELRNLTLDEPVTALVSPEPSDTLWRVELPPAEADLALVLAR